MNLDRSVPIPAPERLYTPRNPPPPLDDTLAAPERRAEPPPVRSRPDDTARR
jgi:hypothetical protein